MKLPLNLITLITTGSATSIVKRDDNVTYVNLGLQKGNLSIMPPVSYTAYPTNFTKCLSTFTRISDSTMAVLVVPKKELEIGGWVWGYSDYQGRFQSTLTNYKTCREFGAGFIMLLLQQSGQAVMGISQTMTSLSLVYRLQKVNFLDRVL